jgi:hypothetical protein
MWLSVTASEIGPLIPVMKFGSTLEPSFVARPIVPASPFA